MRVTPILVALLLAGCAESANDQAPTPTPSPGSNTSVDGAPDAPREVYAATLDFTTGAAGEVPLELEPGEDTLALSGTWSSETPAPATAGVSVRIVDKDGAAKATCALGVNVATQPDWPACDERVDATNPPYRLVWEGTGSVRFDALVMAE